MDSSKVLTEIRAAIREYWAAEPGTPEHRSLSVVAEKAMDKFELLDSWLSSGKQLPKGWQR